MPARNANFTNGSRGKSELDKLLQSSSCSITSVSNRARTTQFIKHLRHSSSDVAIKARRLQMKVAVAILAALTSPVTRTRAHEGGLHFSAGEPGDPRKAFRVVGITMLENQGTMLYQPGKVYVKRGEQIKFVITNAGLLSHEFILADSADNLKHAALMKKYPDMEHDDPNGKTVQPGAKAEILWRFTTTGTFEFSCLIPGHREAGMVGIITVK